MEKHIHLITRGAHGVMNIIVGNQHINPSSNLDEAVYISHGTNILGKGINPTILPQVMGKIMEQNGLFSFNMFTSL